MVKKGKGDVKVLECPHCGGGIVIDQMNCSIFRHGAASVDPRGRVDDQIAPHASRQASAAKLGHYVTPGGERQSYGCGKPYRMDRATGKLVKCDWNT